MTKASKRLCGTSVLALIVATEMMAPTAARAQTSGGAVVAGQAQIDGQGTARTTITQTSDRAIVNWDRFSLGKGDSAIFRQPGSQSITVNRVTGQDPSAILGSIQANGQVVLINRNGILFGKDSTVDAAGLIATTHDIDAGSFMAGARDLRFVDGGNDQAEVVVQGRITIRDTGIAAFVAPHVRNDGLIVAKMGKVSLGAGKGFGIDLYGDGLIRFAPDAALTKTVTDASGQPVAALVENGGAIEAQGGRILLTASAARDVVNASVNVGGLLRADSATGRGGVITLAASGGGSGAVLTQTESAITVAGAQGGSVSVSGGDVGIGGLIDASSSGLRATGGAVSVAATGSLSLAGTTRATSAYGAGGTLNYSGGDVIENSESRSDASGLIGGGTIRLAADGMVMTSGRYRADGGYAGGGRIDLTAPDIRTLGATLSATGRQQGGLVRIGGAFQGGKTPDANQPYYGSFLGRWGELPVLASAQKTLVNDSTAIDVSSTHGAGGTAVVWSDVQTTFLGAVDARGGAGAKGGSVELSSAGDLRQAALGGVQTGGGNLLLDPKNIVIGETSAISGWVYEGLMGYGYYVGKNVNTGGSATSNSAVGNSIALNATGNLLATTLDQKIFLYKFSDANFSGGSLKGYVAKTATGSGNVAVGVDLRSVSLNAEGDRMVAGGLNLITLIKFDDTNFSGGHLVGIIGEGYHTRSSDLDIDLPANNAFGFGVSLSGDGKTLAAGSYTDYSSNGTLSRTGAVYLISFADRDFTSPKLGLTMGYGYTGAGNYNTGGEANSGGSFGYDVALNYNGTNLAVASANLNDNVGGGNRGGVILYKVSNNATSVSYQGTIGYGYSGGKSLNTGGTGNDSRGLQPYSVSFNSLGNRLAVGGGDNGNVGTGYSYGAAYIVNFTDANFSGGSIDWFFGKGYTASNQFNVSRLESADQFGQSLAFNGAGNRLVVGAPGDDGDGNSTAYAGAIYLFSAIGESVTNKTYSYDPSATVQLAASDIVSQLAAGTSVTLQASNDITVSSAIKVTTNPGVAGVLTMQAGRSLLIGADIQTQGGPVNLYANDLKTNGVDDRYRDAGNAVISMAAGTKINAGDAAVNIELRSGADKTYTASGDISLGSITGRTIMVKNLGPTANSGIVLNSGAILAATGNGNVLNLVGQRFTNNTGTDPLSAINGSWRIWSTDPDTDAVGVLDFAFKQYNASFGASLSGTGNALVYSRAPVLGATLSGYSKVYDQTTAASTAVPVATNVVGSDIVTLRGTTSFGDKNVGTGKRMFGEATGIVSATTFDGKPVYGYTLSSNDREFVVFDGAITAAPLTLTGGAVTTRAYDRTTNASVTGTLNGVFSGDTVTLQSLTGTFNNRNVGTNKAVTLSGYTLAGTDAGNYTLTLPTGLTGEITRATLAVTGVTAENKVYDGGLSATISGGTVTPFSGDTVTLDRSAVTAAFGTKTVGTGKIVMVNGFAISGADAANYVVGQPQLVFADITPKALTVSGTQVFGRDYDGSDVVSLSGASVDGVISGDIASINSATGRMADKNAGLGKAVTAQITLSGADAGNYTVTQPTGLTIDIARKSLSVNGLIVSDRAYDGTRVATVSGGTVSVISGDNATFDTSSGTALFADKNAGSNKAVTLSGYALTGTDAGNYSLVMPTGLTASISRARLAVTGIGIANKTYDGTTAATFTGGTVTGFGSDDLTLDRTNAQANFSDKNAGTGKSVSVGGFVLTGADAGNYMLTAPMGLTADIAPYLLSISGVTASGKVYDGTTAAVLAGGSVTGLGSDVVSLDSSGASGAFADKNVGTNKTVTASGYALTGADAGNYVVANPGGLRASITEAFLTIDGVQALDKTYDAMVDATLLTGSIRAFGGDQVTLETAGVAGRFADKNAGAGKAVTAGGWTISGTDSTNYILVQPTGLTANITRASLAVTGASALDKVYDATTTATVTGATVAGLLGDTVSLDTTGAVAAFADKNAGTGKSVGVTGYALTGTDARNYDLVQPTGLTASISKALLAVTGVTTTDRVYDTTDVVALSGGSVAALDSDIVGLDSTGAIGRLADKAAGTGRAVTATGYVLSGADAGNYTIAQPTGLTANIARAALTVTGASALDRTYDATTLVGVSGGTVTALSGDTVTLDGAAALGRLADKNAGNAKAVTVTGYALGGADGDNYVLTQPSGLTATITRASLAVTGARALDKVYDATTTATVTGATVAGLSGDAVSLDTRAAVAAFADKNAGSGKSVTATGYALSGADAGNYDIVQPSGLTASISKASLAVTGVTTTDRTYDRTDVVALSGGSVTALRSDIVGLDRTGAIGRLADKAAGMGRAVTATGYVLSGADADNYTIAQPLDLTANIARAALTVTGASALDRVYDATTVVGVSGGTVTALSGDTVTLDGAAALGRLADKNAGNAKAVTVTGYALGGADGDNYVLTQPSGLTATITRASLAVTGARALDKVYDATTTATVTGATVAGLSGDAVSLDTTAAVATFADKNAGSGKSVTATGYALSGADAGNYDLVQPTGLTAAISKASLAVTGVTTMDRTYDRTDVVALTGGSITALGSDSVGLDATGAIGRLADKSAGTGRAVTATGYVLSGADADNYQIAQPTGLTANIARASLTVTGASALDRTYDATTLVGVSGGTVTALSGDTVTLDGAAALGRLADKNAGNAKAVTVTGYALGGADEDNYVLTQPSGLTATITRASLAVTGASALDKVYDTTTTATVTGATVAGFSGDTVRLDTTAAVATFADKNAGTGKSVGVTGYALTGTDARNYDLVLPTGLTASISKALLAVTGVTTTDRVYDTTDVVALSGGSLAALGSDIVGLDATGAIGRLADKAAGMGRAVTASGYVLSGADAGNYQIAQPLGLTADIARAALAVTGASALDRVYDATTVVGVLGGTVTALSGDIVTLDGASALGHLADKNVGIAKAVTVTGYALGGADGDNYVLTQPTGLTATITRASLAVTGARALDKVYDATTLTSLAGGGVAALAADIVALDASGASGRFDDKNAGTGKSVTASGYALSGVDAGNYDLVQPTGLTASIARAALAVTGAVATDRTYDSTTIAHVSGGAVLALAGDVVALDTSGAQGRFADKNAGAAKAVAATGYALSGVDADNYQLVQPVGLTASIARAALAVTGATATDRVYDTTTIADVSGGVVRALAGDSVDLDGSGARGRFADKNVGLAKAVTVTGYSISGADAGNYALVQPNDVVASITPAALAVTGATARDKVYDGNATAVVAGAGITPLAGDLVSLDTTGMTASFSDRHVGTAKAVSVTGYRLSGADAGNYILRQPVGLTATITRLDSVTWTGAGDGGNWFDPRNWTGGAIPDGSNVATVLLPSQATVRFDNTTTLGAASSGPVSIDRLDIVGMREGANTGLAMLAGQLNIADSLWINSLEQKGGLITGPGSIHVLDRLNQTAGSIAVGGDIVVRQKDGELSFVSLTGRTVNLESAGSVRAGEVHGQRDVTIRAGSDIVLNGPTVSGGTMTIAAGLSGEGSITQVGPIVSSGQTVMYAPGTITLDPSKNSFGSLTTCGATAGSTPGECRDNGADQARSLADRLIGRLGALGSVSGGVLPGSSDMFGIGTTRNLGDFAPLVKPLTPIEIIASREPNTPTIQVRWRGSAVNLGTNLYQGAR